jgi:hypothetical protein
VYWLLLAQELEDQGITQALLYNDALGVPVVVLEQAGYYAPRHESLLSPRRALMAAMAVQEVLEQDVVVVHLEPRAIRLSFYDPSFLGFHAERGSLGIALEELADSWGVMF